MNVKRAAMTHTIMKVSRIKDEERILKTVQENKSPDTLKILKGKKILSTKLFVFLSFSSLFSLY